MASEKKRSDEKQTAASYIINFYNEVENLTHNGILYKNLLIEMDNTYSELDLEENKIPEENKAQLVAAAQQVRYFAQKCYIKYRAIIIKLDKKVDKEIEKQYNEVIKEYIIKRPVLDEFIFSMNSVLMNEVMINLLETSQNIVEGLYSD